MYLIPIFIRFRFEQFLELKIANKIRFEECQIFSFKNPLVSVSNRDHAVRRLTLLWIQ